MDQRIARLGMRVKPDDKKVWQLAAKKEGKSLSAWIEFVLNDASRSMLK